MRNRVSGWMRNNPWEPWCLMVPSAGEAGDAIHAMRVTYQEAINRGCLPSRLALPIGVMPTKQTDRVFDEVLPEPEGDSE